MPGACPLSGACAVTHHTQHVTAWKRHENKTRPSRHGRAHACELRTVNAAGAAQEVEYVKTDEKLTRLEDCLQKTAPPVMVFAEKTRDVDMVHEALLMRNINAVAIHGAPPTAALLTAAVRTDPATFAQLRAIGVLRYRHGQPVSGCGARGSGLRGSLDKGGVPEAPGHGCLQSAGAACFFGAGRHGSRFVVHKVRVTGGRATGGCGRRDRSADTPPLCLRLTRAARAATVLCCQR